MSLTSAATAIRPFRIEVPEEQLAELRRRLAATSWPSSELVADRAQGVQLATIQALARYWTTGYDWRACEARLNALPQFETEIDGVDVRFIHVKSRHEDALPLIMTHGWPGSVIELLEVVGPLTDPTAHGGRGEDAFHLVLPSLWEDGRALAQARASGQAPPEVSLPVGFTTFPGEIWRTPRSWVENSYPNVTYFHEVDRGGHFAAWEEPELFAAEIRAAFSSLR